MSEEQALVPSLRFPEFRDSGEWVVKKLGDKDISSFVKKRVSVNDLELDSYVSTENILPNFGGIKGASKLPPSGSFTSYKPEDILIANIRPYLKKIWVADRNGAASNDVVVVRPMKGIIGSFLSSLLRSDSFIDYVMKGAKGVKMPRGDVSLMKDYSLAVPCPTEQKKIADCLSSIDTLIAAQAEKIDALKTHKKGLMQQLFPREGETIPRLRFPEFRDAGEWGSKELGEFTIKVGSGITPRGGDKNYTTKGRPFVRSQNIGWGNLILDDIVYIDERTHATFSSTEIMINDVLLNISGASIGRSSIANEFVSGGNVNQHVCIIRTDFRRLNPLFLNQFLLSKQGQKKINSFQAGGNRQGLNFGQIRSFSIPLTPKLKEQKKIADCLSSLDALIAAQTDKLDALKNHKKGMMQQLFPSVEVGDV